MSPKKGLIAHLHKRNGNLTDEQELYKGAFRTFNTEVNELREKMEEEGRQKKKEQEVIATVEKELTALLRQVETARANAMKEFKTS